MLKFITRIRLLALALSIFLLLFVSGLSAQISCTGSLNVRVVGADAPMTVQYSLSNLYCRGASDGRVVIEPEGGTPPYYFLWSDGDDQQERSNLSAGDYSVTIHDSNNCIDTVHIRMAQIEPNLENNLQLADQYGCGGCFISDGEYSFIFQDDNEDFMLRVNDLTDGQSIGQVDVCMDLYPDNIRMGDRMLLKRYWAVKAADLSTRITLYFDLAEVEDLATESGHRSFGSTFLDTADVRLITLKGGLSTYDSYDVMDIIEKAGSNQLRFSSASSVGSGLWSAIFRYSDLDSSAYTGFYLDIPYVNSVTTSVEEVVRQDTFDFYLVQNPTLRIAELSNNNFDQYVDATISIVDIDGRLLHVEDVPNDNLKSVPVNVADYPPGAYVYVVDIPELRLRKSIEFIKI
jgi:hypothetical protein